MQNRTLFQSSSRRISLTALIDVVFILLLFFMLTTSFQHWKQLELNVGSTAGTATSQQKNLVLLLTTQAELIVSGKQQTFAHYSQLDTQTIQQLGSNNVTLLPSRSNQMQTVIDALQHLKRLGANASLGESYGSELNVGQAK